MKFKLLGTAILSSALLLTACGQSEDHSKKDDDKKSESKSDKKSNDPKKNKDKKSEENKEKDNNKEKDQSSEDNQQNEQSNAQNNSQNNSNQNNQQAQQSQQQPAQNQQTNQSNHKPTKEEIYEWNKQNIPGGTDAGLIDPEEANKASQSQNNEPDEWVKGQEEWANASKSEKEEIRKQDAQKYGYEYDPKNYED